MSVPATAEATLSAGVSLPETAGRTKQVSVQEGYKLWAANYDTDANPLLALEERELAPLFSDLGNKDLLDVGCGTGRWLRTVAARGARTAVGVDFSVAMLKRASHDIVKHDLIQADCLALPIRPRSADLLLCSFTLSHIHDIGALAAECSRVARPGADAFLTDLHPQAYALGWRVGFRSKGARIEVAAWLHNKEDIQHSFEGCGFKLIEMRDLHLDEPERPIFTRAGKELAFEQACAIPAVLLCYFRRV